jgi:hypothetical protein
MLMITDPAPEGEGPGVGSVSLNGAKAPRRSPLRYALRELSSFRSGSKKDRPFPRAPIIYFTIHRNKVIPSLNGSRGMGWLAYKCVSIPSIRPTGSSES